MSCIKIKKITNRCIPIRKETADSDKRYTKYIWRQSTKCYRKAKTDEKDWNQRHIWYFKRCKYSTPVLNSSREFFMFSAINVSNKTMTCAKFLLKYYFFEIIRGLWKQQIQQFSNWYASEGPKVHTAHQIGTVSECNKWILNSSHTKDVDICICTCKGRYLPNRKLYLLKNFLW